jgi:hypothetical protein
MNMGNELSAILFKDHTKLKPCPFCGSKWEGAISGDSQSPKIGLLVYDNAPSSDMKPWAHVVCLGCGAGQSTIAKWNMRVSDPSLFSSLFIYPTLTTT